MKVLIIEDETAAAVNLTSLLHKVAPTVEVEGVVETVTDSVKRFRTDPQPDLVFMDIHLADGDAFRIFDQIEVTVPIIFTTAYNQYALDAFRVNSIDYLLKPIKESELARALAKYDTLRGKDREEYVERANSMAQQSTRSAFLIHMKDKLIPLKTEEIAYFYTTDEKVSAGTHDGRTLPVDGTLDGIIKDLPANGFFRANRQFIISRNAVKDISVWFGSRLSLQLKTGTPERIIISKAKVPDFKKWLTATGL